MSDLINNIPCICGHLEKDHKIYISETFPGIPFKLRCDPCVLIGKAGAGLFHDYKGDNLKYLEDKLSED